MAPTTASQVARYLICKAHERGDAITNLKLQKLLYYAQGWYLALYDEPLFDDRLEAWVHGAVQPQVYSLYKQFLWEPISASVTCPKFADKEVSSHIDKVLGHYGRYSARDLERMIHRESPWQKARGHIPEDKPSKAVIKHQDMKEYFREIGRKNRNRRAHGQKEESA